MHQDRPLNDYTKAELREFLTLMQKMPRVVPDRLKNVPMPLILNYMEQDPEVATLTPKTIESYRKDLFMIFNFAMVADMGAGTPEPTWRPLRSIRRVCS